MQLRSQNYRSLLMLVLATSLSACGGSSEAPTPALTADEVAAPQPPQKIDIASIRARAKTAMFVPAPSEFQTALEASGVDANLSLMVTPDVRSIEGKGAAVIALVAGVRVANVLLITEKAEKETLILNLKSARDALHLLKLSEPLLKELDLALSEYEAGHLVAAEVAALMDVYAGKVQGDLEKTAGEQVATLVRAGGWVQMANLLSRTLKEKNQTGDAAALLRQPSLLLFFLEFIKASPDAQAGDTAVTTVIAEMEQLMTIAQKDMLTSQDISQIVTHTDAILSQF